MNLIFGLIAIAISAATCLRFLPCKALLPTLTFVLAYGATTVVGASFLLDPFGRTQFTYFIGTDAVEHMDTLGGALYWSLLLMPLALVPIGSLIGYQLSRPLLSGFASSFTARSLWLPSTAWLLVILTSFCLYKLWLVGALTPLSAIDPNGCIEEKFNVALS